MGAGLYFGDWTIALEGGRFGLLDVLWRVLTLVALYAGFLFLQRSLKRVPVLRRASLQINLFVLCLLIMLLLSPQLGQLTYPVLTGVTVAAVFFAITVGLQLLDVVAFDWTARWQKSPPVPLVIRDIGRWLLGLLVLVLLVRSYFPGANLNVLAVSSIVIGYVVGNATQDTLGNLVAGVALNAERPFQIGDWVTVSGHTGVVVDTTWRATRLRTRTDDYIVIPNSSIAREPILNFSRPTTCHGCQVEVGVSYDTPPSKARETIRTVLAGIPEVRQDPPPQIYLKTFGDSSINFMVRCFIDDYAHLEVIQSLVLDRIWYAFKREGISIPFPIRDVRWRDAQRDEAEQAAAELAAKRRLLEGVDLLQSLSADEMVRLAAEVAGVPYAAGETLFRQGEPGDTFYVMRRGRVVVLAVQGDGAEVPVARLGPGAFFGEMSLLTGEPRAATIRAETDTLVLAVGKAQFAGLLQRDPGLAARLAAVIDARQADRQAKLDAKAGADATVAAREPVLDRIRRFFGMT